MKSKIPKDAFNFYVSLGPQRSYQATADHYGVSKCAVTKCAARENWAERLEKIEADARAISDKQLTETLAEMHDRHAKALKAIYVRSVEALRSMPFDNLMDGVKGMEMVIRAERLMAGEATKRTEKSVVEIMKAEMHSMLKIVPAEEAPRMVDATVLVGAGDDDDGEDEPEADVEDEEDI